MSSLTNSIRSRNDIKYCESEEVVVSAKPTKRLIALILDAYPNLKHIIFSERVRRYIPIRYIKTLNELGIKCSFKKLKKGRKGYDEQFKKKVVAFSKKHGVSKTIRKFKVSRRTIYYWKKLYR